MTPIKACRQRAGITQAQLAVRAGCTERYIRKLERGQSEPKAPLLLRLATVLGCQPQDLVADSYRNHSSVYTRSD